MLSMTRAKCAKTPINTVDQNLLGFFKMLVDIKTSQVGSKINNDLKRRDDNRFRTIQENKLTLKRAQKVSK